MKSTLKVLATLFILVGSAATRADDGLSATVQHMIHPLVMGKDHNEAGKITINLPESETATLKSIKLSLEGTTDLADIDSVAGFIGTGSKGFTTAEPLGKPTSPKSTVVIKADHPLAKGRNVVWLSCKLKPTANLDHRIQITCAEIETSAGVIKPKSDRPDHAYRIGVALRQASQDGVHTYRIPALATSTKGTLLCVFDIRRNSSKDLQEDIDVGLTRSTDGGQTWGPTQVIMDIGTYGGLPQKENGVGDPGLLVDQNTGEIFCFALWVHAKAGKHQWKGDGSEPGFEIGKTAQFMVVRSTDDGATWSKPENITRDVKKESWHLFAPSPQQGITLEDGTLIMPVQGRDEDGPFAGLLFSEDHGKTWQVSNKAHSGGNECQAAQLADGSIMLNIRNGDQKRRAVAVTKDKGQSWQYHPTHERDLIEPTCNGSLYRWTSSAGAPPLLLFANPQSIAARVQHTILVSPDDGMTWPKDRRLLLDEGKGFGYPSLSRVDDDHIGIVYEGSSSHLVFERIRRDELGQ